MSGSFPDWTFSGSASFIRETYLQYDGDSYTIISADSNGDHFFYQDLAAANLTVGKTYFLSFRFQIRDADLTVGSGGGARVQLAIRGGQDDGVVFAASKLASSRTDENWTPVTVAFTARTENTRISVGMWNASGTLAIDDVRINVMEDLDGAALVNPDLEPFGAVGSVPYGWTAHLHNGTIETANDDHRSGSACLKMTRTTTGTTNLTQTISFPSGQLTSYEGSFYVKTESVGSAGCCLRVVQTVTGGTQDIFVSDVYSGDTGWVRIPFSFKTVADGSAQYLLTFSLELNDAGTCRFDSLVFRRVPLLAADFDDPDWQTRWSKTGDGSYAVLTESGKKKLRITNSTTGTTTVTQSFKAVEGLTYSIYGTIKADLAIPTDESGGAYLLIYDNSNDVLVDQVGPFTDLNDWQNWHVSVKTTATTNPLTNRYTLKLLLDNCSGYVDIGTIGVYSNTNADRVSIIPQPRVLNLYHDRTFMELEGQTWTVVYEGTDEDDLRCVNELVRDLTCGGRTDNIDFYHYFEKIPSTVVKKEINSFEYTGHGPTIIIGQVDTSIPLLLQKLMEDRKIDPKYVASLVQEGFVLDIPTDSNPVILILSSTKAGRYYGVQAFLQLIQSSVTSTTQPKAYPIPCLRIADWPEMRVRAVHVPYPNHYKAGESAHYGEINKNQYDCSLLLPRSSQDSRSAMDAYIQLMSRMRINMMIFDTPMFFCLEENSGYGDQYSQYAKNKDFMQAVFNMCRKYYIVPVPELQTMGHALGVLQFMPNAVEYALVGQASDGSFPGGIDPNNPVYPFTNADVENPDIDSPMPQPPFVVQLANAERTYILGRHHEDPSIIRGTYCVLYEPEGVHPIIVEQKQSDNSWRTLFDWEYQINYKPVDCNRKDGYYAAAIGRTPAGITAKPGENCSITFGNSFSDGDIFRISYHHVNRPIAGNYGEGSYSYCPKHTGMQNLLKSSLDKVMLHLEQPNFIHFGHDEPQQMHTCGKCFLVQDYGSGSSAISATGILFAQDVEYLRGYYLQLCGTAGKTGNPIIFGDHVTNAHEEGKATHYYSPYRWWDYRGRRYHFEGANRVYDELGYVNSCSLKLSRDIIINEWNYVLEKEHDWDDWSKAAYITELTGKGFNVIGGSDGEADWPDGGAIYSRDYCGAMVRAVFYNDTYDEEGRFILYGFCSLEGTMEEYLPVMNASGRIYCVGDDHPLKQYWFVWKDLTGFPDTTPADKTYSKVRVECDITGLDAEGKAWFDDVTVEAFLSGFWNRIVGIDSTPPSNYSFETLTGQTFSNWVNPTDYHVSINHDELIFHRDDSTTNIRSCRLISAQDSTSRDWSASLYQSIPLDTPLPTGTNLRIKFFARSRKVDTHRMGSPWQWVVCGNNLNKNGNGTGDYLGSVNLNWNYNGEFLPRDDYNQLRYKNRAADLAVANWCWRHDYPADYKLKNIWFEPFLVLLKEVPWHSR